MDEERKEYLKKYKKENLKRIELNVKSEDYEKIKLAAETDCVSVSRYIKALIEADLEKKENGIAYKIVKHRKDNAGNPLDYYINAPQRELERVLFTAVNVAGQKIGTAVALLTPEEAAKFRAAQKENSQKADSWR